MSTKAQAGMTAELKKVQRAAIKETRVKEVKPKSPRKPRPKKPHKSSAKVQETLVATICDVVVFSREVEIPTQCPKCHKEFAQAGSIKCRWLVPESCCGQIQRQYLKGWGPSEASAEDPMVVSYACAWCGHVLAEGREVSFEVR